MRYTLIFLIALLVSCQQHENPAPPLVDGSIEDFRSLNVPPIELMSETNLYFYQDKHYVWIAFDYPDGSYGTADLKLLSPKLSDTINLHVSAQLGEWYLTEGSPRPDNPQSDLWWNHSGWYANEVWPNGTDNSGEEPQPNFKNAKAREIQISKERFGKGEWKLQIEIRAIQTSEGFTSITFPENDFHQLEVF
ncbi:hypothetical protein [Ekhidna sp.]|uniref:hypothetical protein n=1 Tax=Ekhidna sp. TaxID=2608089 RepID=UPI003BAA14FD